MASDIDRVTRRAIEFFNVLDLFYKRAMEPAAAPAIASVERVEDEVDAVVALSLALNAFADLSLERLSAGPREWVNQNRPVFLATIKRLIAEADAAKG